MKVAISERFFALGFAVIVLMFACCAMALIAFAGIELWRSVQPEAPLTLTNRFDLILNCIAMLTIAMAAMALAHTVVEEEFDHESRLSAAARTRRVLSRFLVVVIAAAMLVAWGLFIRMGPREEPQES